MRKVCIYLVAIHDFSNRIYKNDSPSQPIPISISQPLRSWNNVAYSKPRLDLPPRILQRPLAPRRATPDPIRLVAREPLGLDRGVVPEPGGLRDVGVGDGVVGLAVGASVEGDDGGAAEAEVVLEGEVAGGDGDEAVRGPAAELPGELGALGEARGAEGVALGDEAAGRVDDAAAAVRDGAAADHGVGLPRSAEAEGVEGDELVGGEAVVEFAQGDRGGRGVGDVGFGEGGAGGALGHAVADEVDGGAVEEVGPVGREVLAGDEDGLGPEVRAGGEEVFRDDDGGGAAVRGGAALEFGEGGVDGWGGEDLIEGVDVAELGVGVFGGVEVVDAGDFGQVVFVGAVSGEG